MEESQRCTGKLLDSNAGLMSLEEEGRKKDWIEKKILDWHTARKSGKES